MKAIWMVLVMCVSIVCVTGCSLSNQTAFGHDGLPKEQYRVGGGLLIEYKSRPRMELSIWWIRNPANSL